MDWPQSPGFTFICTELGIPSLAHCSLILDGHSLCHWLWFWGFGWSWKKIWALQFRGSSWSYKILNCLEFFCHGITKFYFSEGFQELEPPRSCQFEPLKCRDTVLLGSASFTTPSLKGWCKFSESDLVPQSHLIKGDIRLRRSRDSSADQHWESAFSVHPDRDDFYSKIQLKLNSLWEVSATTPGL